MKERSDMKKWGFLGNGKTDFGKQNICCSNQKDYFQKKILDFLDEK